MTDARKDYPATSRNREPILEVLRRVLPQQGLVLEIAAGTGQHAAFFASALPQLSWQPTDPDPELRASIDAWRAEAALDNLLPALDLKTTTLPWPVAEADAIYCANMIHIAPWSAAQGLLQGAGRLLGPGGVLVLYGPFHRDGGPTSESNARFDASLRGRDSSWGVRHLEEVAEVARENGLELDEVVGMPANNLSVIFRR